MAQFQWKTGLISIQTFPLLSFSPRQLAPFGSSSIKSLCLFLLFSYFTFCLDKLKCSPMQRGAQVTDFSPSW